MYQVYHTRFSTELRLLVRNFFVCTAHRLCLKKDIRCGRYAFVGWRVFQERRRRENAEGKVSELSVELENLQKEMVLKEKRMQDAEKALLGDVLRVVLCFPCTTNA